ncbi:MAG: acetylornithine/N-succinyldiaminopimelate aminotransferase [Kiritimatiellia bacterium]|jgi:acetylornithine/N-succinyldiaminopimelate aminotransferase
METPEPTPAETPEALEALQELYCEYLMPTYAPSLALVRGKGMQVWDINGRKYLDFLGGIAVSTLGHAHPAILSALRNQAGKILHTSNLYYNELMPQVARQLSLRSLGGKAFICNSGAEANEALIKLARLWGSPQGRHEIITFNKSFHGRTLGTLSATGQEKMHQGFAPLLQGFSYAELNDLDSVEARLTDKTVAIMVEPIQGEGGIRPADPAFLQGLRELCNKHRLLLLCDEIQTGLGRTGEWFAYQHAGIVPDAISIAKGLGGGVPIGAIVATPELSNVFQPGSHGSTFGGNPLMCAAALAVLETLEKKGLVEKAKVNGELLKSRLLKLQKKHPSIEDVRGMGLMVGIVMSRPCKELETQLMRNGLITVATAQNVIRLLPPLVVTPAQIKKAVKIIDQSIKEWQEYH